MGDIEKDKDKTINILENGIKTIKDNINKGIDKDRQT